MTKKDPPLLLPSPPNARPPLFLLLHSLLILFLSSSRLLFSILVISFMLSFLFFFSVFSISSSLFFLPSYSFLTSSSSFSAYTLILWPLVVHHYSHDDYVYT